MSIWKGIQFVGKGDEKILRFYDDLLGYVLKQMDSLKQLVAYVAEEDWELASNAATMIGTFESLADDTKQDASLRICRGAFFSGLSEQFLELFERIDDMADAAKDASMAATEVNLHTSVFHSLLGNQDSIYDMIDNVTQCIKVLRTAIENLARGSDLVVESVLEVRKYEKLADNVKTKLMKRLYSQRCEVDLLILLQIKEFIASLDLIADAAEDSSETLLAIVAKAE